MKPGTRQDERVGLDDRHRRRRYETVILPHRAAVESYAHRLCPRHAADAEDLAQDTLLRAWERLEQLTTEHPPMVRGWLKAITLNLARNGWRLGTIRKGYAFGDPERGGVRDPIELDAWTEGTADVLLGGVRTACCGSTSASAETVAIAHLEREAVGVALGELDRLQPKMAEPLRLRAQEEASYEEIAQTLGVPDGTVKSRVSRGREWMCRRMAGWRDD